MSRLPSCVSSYPHSLCPSYPGRCNLPLLNSPVVEEPALDSEDKSALACKVCGMRHSLETGEVRGCFLIFLKSLAW